MDIILLLGHTPLPVKTIYSVPAQEWLLIYFARADIKLMKVETSPKDLGATTFYRLVMRCLPISQQVLLLTVTTSAPVGLQKALL